MSATFDAQSSQVNDGVVPAARIERVHDLSDDAHFATLAQDAFDRHIYAQVHQSQSKMHMEKGETAAEEERTGLHHRRDAVVEEFGDPDRPMRVRPVERVDPFVRRQIFERSSKQFCG